jgi:hypothetical protein
MAFQFKAPSDAFFAGVQNGLKTTNIQQDNALQDISLKAANGDQNALAALNRLDPRRQLAQMGIQEQQLKQAGQLAKAVNDLPEAQRPAAYASLAGQFKQLDPDLTGDYLQDAPHLTAAASLYDTMNPTKNQIVSSGGNVFSVDPRTNELQTLYSNPNPGGLTPYQQASLENQRVSREAALAARQDAADLKEQNYRQTVAVPGFDIAPGFRPNDKSAGELRNISTARNVIGTELRNLRNLVEKNGTEYGFGAAQNQMQNAAQRIQLNLKELENLGVLNGPDMEILAKSFADPTSLRNQFRDNKTLLNSYDDFDNYLTARVNETGKARGYQPLNQVRDATPPAKDNSGGLNQVQTPKRGQIIDGYLYKGGDPANPSSWKKQ